MHNTIIPANGSTYTFTKPVQFPPKFLQFNPRKDVLI